MLSNYFFNPIIPMNALLEVPLMLHTLLLTPFDIHKFTILGNEMFKLCFKILYMKLQK
jgi:hypothetical protein